MLGNQSNKIYLSIADGKIVRKVAEGMAGAEARTKKDGAVYFVQTYSFITGIIRSISTKTNNFNGQDMKDWVFEIEDGHETYTLQSMFNSRYSTSLLNALCNPAVDFSKPITISPWMKIVNEKKKTACYVKQGEQQIDWYFTKDNPNGLPPLKIVQFKGKDQYDDYDMMQFLEKYVETKIKPHLSTSAGLAPEYTPPVDVVTSLDEDDDLPF